MVPVIKDIIRLPKEDPEPLGVSARKRSKKPNSRIKAEGEDRKEVMVFNPEEGWDDETDPHGIVMDYSTHDEVRRSEDFLFPSSLLTKAWHHKELPSPREW